MSIVYILLAVTTVANLIWMAANFAEGDALDEKESDLDKYAVHLDERANRLAADEETIRMLNKQLRDEIKKREEAVSEQPLDDETQYVCDGVEERFLSVLSAAERATGWTMTDSRRSENSLIRTFIAYKMHDEGFSYEKIGKAMHRNHSTITHMVKKMEDMLSVPAAYKAEIDMYNKMCGML